MFIGLNTTEDDGQVIYTVDYWELEGSGKESEIKAGKQKTFTL